VSLQVGFDGRALVSPAAGVRRYARELFGAMAALDPNAALVAVGAPHGTPLPPGIAAQPAAPSLPTNLGWALTGLPLSARRGRFDLFHAPAYTAPLCGVRPLVLTIHDVSYARHPEWYPYRRDPMRRAFYRRSALAADRIITDSEFSRGEIAAAYDIAEDRIAVIPLGVGEPFLIPPGATPPGRVGRKPQAPSPEPRAPFVLHVGDLHERRNLGTALRAVLDVRRRHREWRDLRLVLAGVDRGLWPALQRVAVDDPGAVEHVTCPSDLDLAALYRAAAALIYPSRYEGFGLPILEAMACGTPVIAARAASIPEVAGDAALLLDPDDTGGFADALEQVLGSTGMRERLSAAGRARAAGFTWSRTAQLTLDLYRGVLMS
jgi:alpha-1,3-rhamnosyl/mannosyltransferase